MALQWKPGSGLLPLLLIKTAQQTLVMMPKGYGHWCYHVTTPSSHTNRRKTGVITKTATQLKNRNIGDLLAFGNGARMLGCKEKYKDIFMDSADRYN